MFHKELSSDSQLPHKNAVNCLSPILTLWRWRQQDGSLGACWPVHLGELPWLGSSSKTKAENGGGKHTAWLLVHNHFHHPYTHVLIHQHRTKPVCLRHVSRALLRWRSCSASKGLSYGIEGIFQVQLCFLNHLSPSMINDATLHGGADPRMTLDNYHLAFVSGFHVSDALYLLIRML